MKRIYQCALGIETGDILRTSYNTGPYKVLSIRGPYNTEQVGSELYILRDTCISVRLQHTVSKGIDYWINGICKRDERWLSGKDEIFVEKPPKRANLPIDMFLSYPQEPEPYCCQPDVDYSNTVWKCEKCRRDYNWQPPQRYDRIRCPFCNHWFSLRVFLPGDPASTWGYSVPGFK